MNRYKFVIIKILFLLPCAVFAKESCKLGKHWVSAHYRKAYTKYDGTRVRATQVKAYCRENSRGYEKWHQRLSDKRPKIWGYGKEKSKKWTVEEIQRLLDAISVLPEELINLKNVKVYKMVKSKFPENPATSNGNDITLYDEAFVHKNSLTQILSHELSHIIYRGLSEEDKGSFAKKAKWVKEEDASGNTYHTTKPDKVFIQPDSRDSVSEDFANHLEHYLFKNNSLRRNTPASYKWIREKVGKNFKILGENR